MAVETFTSDKGFLRNHSGHLDQATSVGLSPILAASCGCNSNRERQCKILAYRLGLRHLECPRIPTHIRDKRSRANKLYVDEPMGLNVNITGKVHD